MSEAKNPVEVVNMRRFLMLQTKGEAFTAAYEAEKGRQVAIAEAEADRESRARIMAELAQVEPCKTDKPGTLKRWTDELLAELVEYRKTHSQSECAERYGVGRSRIGQLLKEAESKGIFSKNFRPSIPASWHP